MRFAAPLFLLLLTSCSVLEESWLSQAPLPDHEAREVEATFAGNDNVSDRLLRIAIRPDMLGLSQGLDADAAAYDAADAIAEFCRSRGFPDATAEYRVEGPTERRGEPDLVTVHFTVREGPEVTVTKLDITGNQAAEASELKELWSRRNSGTLGLGDPLYVHAELRAFAEQIRDWYWRHGYLEVVVDGPDVSRAEGAATATVALRITEGRQFRFGRITLAPALVAALGPELPRLPEGEVFSTARAQEVLLAVRSGLLHRGHPKPQVGIPPLPDVTALPEPRIDLEIQGRPGPRVFVGDIDVVGNERTRTGYIRSQLKFEEGDLYDGLAEEKALSRLYGTGLFARVTIEHGEIANRALPLRVRVEELEARSIEFLGGYGSYEMLRGGIRYEDRNLFGSGRELAIEGRASQRGYRTATTLTDRDLLGADVIGSVGVEWFQRQQPAFTDRAFGSTLTFRKSLGNAVVGRVGYSYLEHNGDDEVPDPNRRENYTQGTVFGELRRDDRDNPVLPHRGSTLFVRADFTDPTFGADVDFDRLRAGGAYLLPLGDDTVLGLDAEAGWLWPAAGGGSVPLPERFFNGGQDSVRSFREDHLGPKDLQGNPLGGAYRNILSAELRQRIYGPLEVAMFGDAGNVGEQAADYGFDHLRYALGIGLRLQLPIGPVRLDAGYNPDRQPGEEEWVLHFAIGYPF